MAKPRRRPVRDFLWRHAALVAMVVMVVFIAGIAFVGYNYVLITRKFDSSRRWDLPSRIYSEATPIYAGLSYSRSLLEPKLNQIGYTEVSRPLKGQGEYRFDGEAMEIYLQDFDYPEMSFTGFPVRIEFDGSTVQRIVRLNDGIRLKAIRLEPELITSIYDEVMEDRVPIPLEVVPQHLIDAILVTEDRTFFTHEGISIRGILRAAIQNFRKGGVTAGGSTLTQQLVKNLYLTPERNWQR
jgi:penicillin-binding protein 1B